MTLPSIPAASHSMEGRRDRAVRPGVVLPTPSNPAGAFHYPLAASGIQLTPSGIALNNTFEAEAVVPCDAPKEHSGPLLQLDALLEDERIASGQTDSQTQIM